MVHLHRARRDRGARQGHRADAAAADRRPAHPPGRAALALGLQRRARPGDSANDLVRALAATRTCHRGAKAFTCDVRAGRAATAATSRVTGAARRRGRRDHAAEQPKPSADAARPMSAVPHAPLTEIASTAPGARADGLLHRHDGVHRLQGVRGRLQAVERPARRRRRSSARAAPTTTRASSARRPGATCASSSCSTLGVRARRRGAGPRRRRRLPTSRRRPADAARRRPRPTWRPRRGGRAASTARWTAGSSCPTSASTARTPAASTPARRAR